MHVIATVAIGSYDDGEGHCVVLKETEPIPIFSAFFDTVDSEGEPPVPLRLDLLRLSQNFHHHNVIGSYVVVTRIGD